MNLIRQLITRGWKPVLILTWILALVSLFPNHYTFFLRPAFGWILIIAVIILSGMFGTSIERSQTPLFGRSEILRAMILILPLAHLFNVRGTSLDAYAFQNRSVGLPSLPTINDARPAGMTPSPDDPNRESGGMCRDVTLLDLYTDPHDYIDQRVKLVGMYYREESAMKDLSADTCVIFRFTINCCAADATPLAILANVSKRPDLVSSTWVEVEGTFTIKKDKGRNSPVLLNAVLRQTTSPKYPYLF